jgi:hypothetical protein
LEFSVDCLWKDAKLKYRVEGNLLGSNLGMRASRLVFGSQAIEANPIFDESSMVVWGKVCF